MKKLLLLTAFPVCLLASLLLYSEEGETPLRLLLDNFGGVNTYYETSKIEDIDAIEAENVLTDAGYLEKRTGNVRAATILSGYGIKWHKEFIDSSGTRYIMAHSSDSLYYSNLFADPVLLSSVAVNGDLDGIGAFNNFYFTDGTNRIKFWNLTSVAAIQQSPAGCKYLEFDNERLYCASATGSTSQVSVSSFAAPTIWTVPSDILADSPNSFTFFRNDGESINCFAVTPWGKFIGKKTSSHALIGYDNNTYVKRILSTTVGCVDDRSVQMRDGRLYWLALDGIYSWDGSNPPRLESKDIETTVLAIRQLNSTRNQWVLSSRTDWERGFSELNGITQAWTSSNTIGSIVPSTANRTDTNSSDFSGAATISRISTSNVANAFTLGIATSGHINSGFEDGASTRWTFGCSAGVVSTNTFYGSYAARSVCTLNDPGIVIHVKDFATNSIVWQKDFGPSASGLVTYDSIDTSTRTDISSIKIVVRFEGVDCLTSSEMPRGDRVGWLWQFRSYSAQVDAACAGQGKPHLLERY